MLTKSQFKKVAKDLIGPKGIFSDFLADCEIVKKGAFSYGTQSSSLTKQTLKMVEAKLVKNGIAKNNTETNTIELIGIYEDLIFEPNVDDTVFTYNGILYQFKSIEIDAAKASITLKGFN